MLRRDFIKSTSTLLAATTLSNSAVSSGEQADRERSIYPLNRNWRFHPSKVEGAESPSYDDAKFERVVIPHTNIKLPWHNFDDKDYEFISTYRRRFRTPANAAGNRVFVDFEGAMTASTVWINGVKLGEYRGGFTPFSFELTAHLHPAEENVLVVQLDSTERPDIPPFGYEIDYLTFGGIYREVALRVVSPMYIDNIFAHARDVLTASPSIDVNCFLAGKLESKGPLTLEVELRDGDKVIAKKQTALTAEGATPSAPDPSAAITGQVHAGPGTGNDPARQTVSLTRLQGMQLWTLDKPVLYTVSVRLLHDGHVIDSDMRRVGFREASFTDQGFSLNGKVIKLRGLDRHQTFPFVGQAMPARAQRKDAKVLRNVLHCNLVRTSHYPQSRHFLDCCDEIGLLVLEEIPGWQHIGDKAWQAVAIDNVDRMIRRDWNHPSIILWGVRINESRDNHDFYTQTNALAHSLDDTRQTGGIRYFQESEFLEDVFTMNDFGFPLKKPNHPRYLNTEFVGHTFPTKTTDDNERQREHTLRHARIHNQLASDPQYAGGIGWCAFDYNTHGDFGSGDRICYHGVTDMFRELKPAGYFYKSQCDPEEEIVLEPAFHWARGDESLMFTKAVVCSNCDHIKFFIQPYRGDHREWVQVGELDPDRTEFEHLKYPPFVLDATGIRAEWGDLRIEGLINGKQVISKTLSGRGVPRKFALIADDTALAADGADTTRVVMRATDEFGALCTYANDAVLLTLDGPADLIGDTPFSLIGGTGAVWVRAKEQAGHVTLTATHPRLGKQIVEITLTPANREEL